jgi:hypothetical protein
MELCPLRVKIRKVQIERCALFQQVVLTEYESRSALIQFGGPRERAHEFKGLICRQDTVKLQLITSKRA